MTVSLTDSPAKAPSASEVADWIRKRIRRGSLAPGQRLVEVDIIRQTGASRFKVREAFQRLEGEGLVITEDFRGASVRTASIDEVRQIYRARVALEGICAADFTRNATAAQIVRLEELQEQLDTCVLEHAPERFGPLNLEWHACLVQGASNEIIRELLERLNVPIHRLLFESFYSPNRLKHANADHHAVLAAIKAGDAEGAESAMRQHVENGFSTLSNISDEFFG